MNGRNFIESSDNKNDSAHPVICQDLFKRLNLDRLIEMKLRKESTEKLKNPDFKEFRIFDKKSESTDASSLSTPSNNYLDFSCIDADPTNFDLNLSEKELINQWTSAFYISRQNTTLEFDLQSRISSHFELNKGILL
jgi:hypothetical protein